MADRDLLRDFARQFNAGRLSAAEADSANVPRPFDPGIAIVRNDTGEDLGTFAVVGLAEPLFDFAVEDVDQTGWLDLPDFSGLTPAFPDHDGRFAILLEPCPDGETARAAIGGLVACKVTVAADEEWYECADVRDLEEEEEGATESLALLPAGAAQVLWREEGTGERWAVVRLGSPPGPPVEKGVLNGEMAAGETAIARVYRAGADTGNTLTLHPPEWFGGTVASGAKVTARWDRWDRIWEGLGAPCAL